MKELLALLILVFAARDSISAARSPERAEAMAKFSYMRGVWVGSAEGIAKDGKRFSVHKTERMGPMLDGDIIVLEENGYKDDGAIVFHAFSVISWDERTKKYEFRTYAQGHADSFEIKPTTTGYVWKMPMGATTVRYTGTIKNGRWREVGERVAPGEERPVKIFEMNVRRVADTEWPSGNPVLPTLGR